MNDFILKTVFAAVKRAFQAVYRSDSKMRVALDELRHGRESVALSVCALDSPVKLDISISNGGISFGSCESADDELKIVFKRASYAVKAFSGLISFVNAYSDKLFCVSGNVTDLMAFLEAGELVTAYLLWSSRAEKLLGYLPELEASRLKIYSGVLFGVSGIF